MDTVSEFGRKALQRRLGELARQWRQEDLGVSREALAEASGISSTKTIRDFEYGQTVPQEGTQAKLERALGWRSGAIRDVLQMMDTKAENIGMEMVLSETRRPTVSRLSSVSTVDLLRELLGRRVELAALIESLDAAAEAEVAHQPPVPDGPGNDDPSLWERLAEEEAERRTYR